MQKINGPRNLILVRHAESERNAAKKGNTYFPDDTARKHVQGIPDQQIAITDLGWEQARATGYALKDKFGKFDYIYHSGYKRTIQTLEGILEAYSEEEKEEMKIRHNVFIRERDAGHAYDMTTEEADHAFPYLKEHWATFGGFYARPPGGESLADISQRVYLFLSMLFRDRMEQNILIVTHGGTIRTFRFLLEKWTEEKFIKEPTPINCGITVYQYDKNKKRLELQEYNSTYWEGDGVLKTG